MPPDPDDPTVKDLLEGGPAALDPSTQADLARWFGLPSITQLQEEGKTVAPPMDPEMAEVIERRQKALAAVDPALLDLIKARTEDRPDPMTFKPTLEVVIDENVAFFDHGMVDRAASIADPREVEISEALIDTLKECTPQALLRDLHRPELFFDKQFEWVDPVAEERVDSVAESRTAMRTNWRLRSFETKTELNESRALLAGVRAQRRQRWVEFLPLLHNRTVRE